MVIATRKVRGRALMTRLGVATGAALLALWIASARWSAQCFRGGSGVSIAHGVLTLSLEDRSLDPASEPFDPGWNAGVHANDPKWRWTGWNWMPFRAVMAGGARTWSVPLWMVAGVVLLLTGAHRLVTRPRIPGRCAGCGYDLTGLGPTLPCPECGRPVAHGRDPRPSP